MKKITLILLGFLLSACDAGSYSTEQGRLIKISQPGFVNGYYKIDIRTDCKNQNCKIESFYYPILEEHKNQVLFTYLERNIKVSFKYHDYVFFKRLTKIEGNYLD